MSGPNRPQTFFDKMVSSKNRQLELDREIELQRLKNAEAGHGTIRLMVSCQVQGCAEDVSYHLDMVRMWEGEPICQDCYIEGGVGMTEIEEAGATVMHQDDWHDLPEVTLADVKA